MKGIVARVGPSREFFPFVLAIGSVSDCSFSVCVGPRARKHRTQFLINVLVGNNYYFNLLRCGLVCCCCMTDPLLTDTALAAPP